ncbi:MAG: DUF3098 domain-containing protein [Calditrichaeota bacterium]|nr:DUF3098 domain-containing protein [Calditrichota bacterium]
MVKKKHAKTSPLVLTKKNYLLFGIGILLIVVGYISMSKGPANSFWSLTLAPIILCIAYLILIPISIFWREKNTQN